MVEVETRQRSRVGAVSMELQGLLRQKSIVGWGLKVHWAGATEVEE